MILLELRNIHDYRAKTHNEHRAYSMAIEPQFRALDRSNAPRERHVVAITAGNLANASPNGNRGPR